MPSSASSDRLEKTRERARAMGCAWSAPPGSTRKWCRTFRDPAPSPTTPPSAFKKALRKASKTIDLLHNTNDDGTERTPRSPSLAPTERDEDRRDRELTEALLRVEASMGRPKSVAPTEIDSDDDDDERRSPSVAPTERRRSLSVAPTERRSPSFAPTERRSLSFAPTELDEDERDEAPMTERGGRSKSRLSGASSRRSPSIASTVEVPDEEWEETASSRRSPSIASTVEVPDEEWEQTVLGEKEKESHQIVQLLAPEQKDRWVLSLLSPMSTSIVVEVARETNLAQARLAHEKPPSTGELRLDVTYAAKQVKGVGHMEDTSRREQHGLKRVADLTDNVEMAEPSSELAPIVKDILERLDEVGSKPKAVDNMLSRLPHNKLVEYANALETEENHLIRDVPEAKSMLFGDRRVGVLMSSLSPSENVLRNKVLTAFNIVKRKLDSIIRIENVRSAEAKETDLRAAAEKKREVLSNLCPPPLRRPKQIQCRGAECLQPQPEGPNERPALLVASTAPRAQLEYGRAIVDRETDMQAGQVITSILDMLKSDSETFAVLQKSKDTHRAGRIQKALSLGGKTAPIPTRSGGRFYEWDPSSVHKITKLRGPCPSIRDRIAGIIALHEGRLQRIEELKEEETRLKHEAGLGNAVLRNVWDEPVLEDTILDLQVKALRNQWDAVLMLRIRGMGVMEACPGGSKESKGSNPSLLLEIVHKYFNKHARLKSLLSPGFLFFVDFPTMPASSNPSFEYALWDIADNVSGGREDFANFLNHVFVTMPEEAEVFRLAGIFAPSKTLAGLLALSRLRPYSKQTPWLRSLIKEISARVPQNQKCEDLMCSAPVLLDNGEESTTKLKDRQSVYAYAKRYHPDKTDTKGEAMKQFAARNRDKILEILSCLSAQKYCVEQENVVSASDDFAHLRLGAHKHQSGAALMPSADGRGRGSGHPPAGRRVSLKAAPRRDRQAPPSSSRRITLRAAPRRYDKQPSSSSRGIKLKEAPRRYDKQPFSSSREIRLKEAQRWDDNNQPSSSSRGIRLKEAPRQEDEEGRRHRRRKVRVKRKHKIVRRKKERSPSIRQEEKTIVAPHTTSKTARGSRDREP